MNMLSRGRLLTIAVILACGIVATLLIVNAVTLRVVSVDPADSVLPTVQKTITVQYSQAIKNASVLKMSPNVNYTTAIKDNSFIISLEGFQQEGVKLSFTIKASGAATTTSSEFSFITRYITLDRMSSAQQELLTNDSAGFSESYPLIGQLPRIDVNGPYIINYGTSPSGSTTASLIISDSTPTGRLAALAWIRTQGLDPTTLSISYDEYRNPLTSTGENE